MTTSINPAPPKPSLWQSLFGIIDKPTNTFKAVLAYPSWLRWGLPLLILLLAFTVVTAAQTPFMRDIALQQAEAQLAQMSDEQVEAARATMEFTMSLPFMLATGIGFGLIALVIGVLAQTAYFYFATMLTGGDDTNFGAMFTISAWTRLPLAIGFLVQAAFVWVSQGAIRYPGLAPLVASGNALEDAKNPIIPLLARFDLFWLWHLLLVVLGVAVVARISRSKSLLLTLIYVVLVLGMAVVPSLIARAFGG